MIEEAGVLSGDWWLCVYSTQLVVHDVHSTLGWFGGMLPQEIYIKNVMTTHQKVRKQGRDDIK